MSNQLNIQENSPLLWLRSFPELQPDDNKYTRGHAVIFGGDLMTGAARLAARAAARVGAGLVTIAVSKKSFEVYAQALLSIMVKPLSSSKIFNELLADQRISAYLIGPGAGAGIRARILTLLKTKNPVVLDADALTVFENDSSLLFKNIQGSVVLTPHEGEFKRIFDISGSRLDRALSAAQLSQAIIVLKGSATIIAAPDGRVVINRNAPPTLATAGSGDVLSGIIAGLLAQKMEPFFAACAAVWLHGEAANIFGVGLIAEDLPDLLPKILQQLKR